MDVSYTASMPRTYSSITVALASLAIACSTHFKVDGDAQDAPSDPVEDASPDAVPDGTDAPPDLEPDAEPDATGIDRPVDVLFVVDNSMSMVEEQMRLAEQFPALIAGILDPPEPTRPVTDLHAGVVSTDMGTGGYEVGGCPDPVDGDDGVLLHTPSSTVSGCDTAYPPYLEYAYETPDSTMIEWISTGLRCIATLGIDGCGFEQQLLASTRALVDHRDGANAGFLRPDSILVVVFLTDEDDCSVAEGSEHIFDPMDSSLGHMGLRCFNHPYMVEPVATYIEVFGSLRPTSADLLLGFIVGVPQVTACEGTGDALSTCLEHEAMTEEVDPVTMTSLLPACEAFDAGTRAMPARRFVQVAQGLGGQAYVQSICDRDFVPTVEWLMGRISELAGG
jgi:hypothetical protein